MAIVTVGGSRVLRQCDTRERTHNHEKGLVDVRGQGCCCYDAMAAAPWEAGEELNEFCPQLGRSGRRQSA